ncbi:dTDP-4-dehydrorhamnose 3,5-epimerase, partial [Planctomycetaceae bacterium]|nr:dTDP-4-dehydrorhamnose 3,5-epimerase [Planctomycetaceae bacterium]
NVYGDDRGRFQEIWNKDRYSEHGIDTDFVQDNVSRSVQGTLRGLHYQLEQPQGKLVQVLSGEIFDVGVDLRRSSPTFGQWVGMHLDGESARQLWIPAGFAHGFQVLSETADVLYKCTNFYLPSAERTVSWNDPDLNINWPGEGDPILTEKDRKGLTLSHAEVFEND